MSMHPAPLACFYSATLACFCSAVDTEIRKVRADRVSNVGRSKVRVVFFRHARIGVTELGGDDA
jgi:hypothetical protein